MSGGRNHDESQTSRKLELAEVKQKIARFCAYQERAHADVEQKLYSFGLYKEEMEELLAWLISENFVNEERYAIAFAGGKFRVKRWGRLKIKQYLEQKKVSQYSIDKALSQIDEEDYVNTVDDLITKAKKNTKASNIYEHRHKISRSLMTKGYEPEIVWERIKLSISDQDHHV